MRYHDTPIRMAKIQSTGNTKRWLDYEQQHASFTAGGNGNGTATLADGLAISYKTKHTHNTTQQSQSLVI